MDRWNHDIPNQYFTDPRYNDGYAVGSLHSSDSHYSSYSEYSYNGAPAYYEQMQQAGTHGYPNNLHSSYFGSSSSSATQRPTASTRHDPTSFSSSSSKRERFYCEHSTCHDKHGHQSSFSRRADLNRHYQSVHGSTLLDCPYPRCERRGARGFPRLDHLIEHRRGYHHDNIPKRESGR
ncbi:hypothetical protein GJ744_009281 [Endocarpon pusillum]|uniref:C2H2-type domain-containing protein n=1 Tax=Endocarpon pusillum TaxID=364733 RepID=A0A8H7AG13_9EURO|nr:hypothetical protein GJ744_009281 [Endocarpon pusillum]